MTKISIEKGQFTDQNNNLVTIWHEIRFEGSLADFKQMYGIKTSCENYSCEEV